MEVTAIAALATQMSQARLASEAQLSVLKTALNLSAEGALQLLEAAVQTTGSATAVASANPPNLGNYVDTYV